MKNRFHAFQARISGLTLIEILVAVAVLGVILAMAIPSMSDLLERRRVTAAAEEVASILTYAKAETNAVNSLLFVRFDPEKPTMSCAVVVTTGGMNICKCHRDPNDICPGTASRPLRLFQLPRTHVKFEAYAPAWATAPAGQRNFIRFARDQNTLATEGFLVDVTGLKKGYTLRVEVNAIGRVKICAPTAPRVAATLFKEMSGYGTCSPVLVP